LGLIKSPTEEYLDIPKTSQDVLRKTVSEQNRAAMEEELSVTNANAKAQAQKE